VIAEKIGGAMKGELPTLDKIMNDTIAKAKNGDFGDPLDVNKVIDYAISQIKAKLADFYPNGMNGLSTTEMGVLYKALEKSAVDSQKPDDLKNAAIMYCKGIIGKKSNAFKEAVSEIFGEDYAQTIKSLTSSEIQKMMADLLAKVEELGDASTFRLSDSDSIWGIFQSKSTATIEMRKSEAIGSLGRSCTIDGKNIATDRITYSSSNSSLISINDSGEVTLNGGSSAGEFQVKVNILIDGIIVGTKTINITVTKVQTFDLPEYDNNECVDIGSGENGGGWANIGNHKDNEAFSDMTLMANCAATCYGNLKGIIDNIVNACKSAGIYDTAALDKAAQKTKELYENALKELFTNRAGKGDSKVVKYNNYNMYSYTEKYASGTEGKSPVSQKASNGDLGITLRISYSNNDTYKCEVNTTCVKDILQKFYREALGV
ncbi:hypothetical protein IJ556_08050, partial [bacterium]|nr:hypothetical protein [bacterium]